MTDNPHKSPKNDLEAATPSLDENTKELLGIAKDDFWYYPGFALLVIACFLSNVPLVVALFAISTGFLLIFLAKSFPKYVRSNELAPATKVFGFLGNFVLIVLQIVVVVAKSWFLLS